MSASACARLAALFTFVQSASDFAMGFKVHSIYFLSQSNSAKVTPFHLGAQGRSLPSLHCLRVGLRQTRLPHRFGDSHLPELADSKMASITAIFLMASSTGTGTSVPSRTALEKASPCKVY